MKREVSIITAAFRAELLDRVWASILAQDILKDPGVKFEWLVINDSQQAVRDWWKQSTFERKFAGYEVIFIDLLEHTGHFGLYARNEGAKNASYDNIIFWDDDNLAESNHISSLFEAKEKTGKFPYCWMRVKGKRPGSTYDKIKRTGLSKQGIDLGCLLYNKQMFKDVGYFEPTSPITFDWDYFEKLIKKYGRDAFVNTGVASLVYFHHRY